MENEKIRLKKKERKKEMKWFGMPEGQTNGKTPIKF